MTRRTLKTTTASLLMISLIQPFPAMAQVRALNIDSAQQSSGKSGADRLFLAQSTEGGESETCFTDGEVDTERCDIEMMRAELEMLLSDGLPAAEDRASEDDLTAALSEEERIGLLSAAIEDAEREASAEPAEEEAGGILESVEQAATEAEAATEELAEEAQAEASEEIEAAEEAAAEAEVEAEAEVSADTEEAQAEAEELAEEATEATEDAADAAEEATSTEAEAEAEAEVEAEADAETAESETEADAETEAEAEAETEADTDTDTAESDTAESDTAESDSEQAAQDEAAEAAETEAEMAAEGEADEAAQAEAEGEAEAEAAAEAEQPEVDEAEASEQKDSEIVADQEAAQGLAAVAAAIEGAVADAEGEVTTEEVTEESARSSDEEFATQATNRAEATPQTRGDDDDEDRGFSSLERGGLLALGALAVGALMTNGQRVAATSGDRVIVEDDSGRFQVLKDDNAVLRQPGSTVETRNFDDGSSTTTVTRQDGTRVVTIRDAMGRVLRRSAFDTNGNETLLINDTAQVEPVNTATLPRPTQQQRLNFSGTTDRDALRAALREAELRDLNRSFSLRQVREIVEVRQLAAEIPLEDVTFQTGSAAIQPTEAERLREIGLLMRDMIREDPREVFLIEGYTDAVGSAPFNLLLSDRRAESVALALTEYFDVPPENMVVQGYGERFLKVQTLEAERQNRRVAVRRITNLIAQR